MAKAKTAAEESYAAMIATRNASVTATGSTAKATTYNEVAHVPSIVLEDTTRQKREILLRVVETNGVPRFDVRHYVTNKVKNTAFYLRNGINGDSPDLKILISGLQALDATLMAYLKRK